MSKRVRENGGKLSICSTLHSKRGITPTKLDGNWRHSNLIWSTVKKSYAIFQLNVSKRVREKCGKMCISSTLSSKRGITPTNINANLRHSNLICSTVKQSHMQNFSSVCKRVREKCGKMCTFSIISSKRGITPTKIDGNWRNSNLICSIEKQSDMRNFNLICQSM